MDTEQRQRARNAILGALVADAASLGLHWVYSQRRITELAPETPEFRQPSVRDYEGGVGYFAHPTKRAGDLSQYGEQMLVMLKSLAQTGGRYDKADYTEQFRRHFGYGGEFVGYIDRPTRQTLDRIYRDEHVALEAVNQITYDGPARDQQAMLTKVLAAVKQHEGDRLIAQVERLAGMMPDPVASRGYGLALVEALSASDEFPGAIDDQLPAVSKLPPLVACHIEDPALTSIAASAIRVTNNTTRAVDFGQVCTQLLRTSMLGEPIPAVITAALEAGSAETRETIERALASDSSVREVSRESGLHCDLGAGVPSLMYNLATASSFTEAIRRNIHAGGDSCGRAIVLGAACGAAFGVGGANGVPSAWINQLSAGEHIDALVGELFGP